MKHIDLLLYNVVIIAISCWTWCEAKTFTRCGLRDELLDQKFEKTFVAQWVCLVDAESGYNTSKVSVAPNGSKKYGIFQINSKEYCKEGKPGGLCNIKCEDLLNDDITDDCQCAKLVQQREGFRAWSGWVRVCKGANVDIYIAHCPPPLNRRLSPEPVIRRPGPKRLAGSKF